MAKKKKTYKDYLEEIARERQLDTRKELADFESFVEENRPIEAPIRSDLTQEKERSWFSGGAFSDGFDLVDIPLTVFGTAGDVASNLLRGVSDVGEGLADLTAGGVAQVADFMGNDDLAKKIRKKLAGEDEEFNKNVERFGMSNKLNKASDFFDKNSLFGEKLDDVTSSAGGLVGSMAGQAVGIPWYLTMGGSSAGRELGNAYQEGATDGEAWLSAGVTGLSEVALEKLSGGIKFGGKSLDELWKGPLTKTITNKTANTLAKFGLDVAGEGGEEVLTEAVQSLGRLSYEEDKTWQEAIASEEAFDNYLEAFIGGGLIGGTFNARRAYNSVKTGRDYETGLTGGEQSVIDAEITNRTTERQKQIAEQQKNEKLEAEIARVIEAETNDRGELTEAKKQALIEDVKSKIEDVDYSTIELSKKELNEIKRQVNEDLERGEIDTFTIENTLFQDSVLRMRELDREMQAADDTRKAEIQAEIDQLQSEVNKTLESNGKLLESYRQKELRKQSFEREVTDQDSDKTKAIVAKAKELGLNNTRQSHEKVDLFIKIAEDSGYDVILTNNEELENKGDYSDEKTAEIRQLKLELKNVSDNAKKAEIQKKIDQLRAERGTIDGFVIKGTGKMFLNVDSPKYIETTVGHEVTHILEENKSYKAYMKFIQDFAKTKGTYDDFKASVESRYKNITKDFDSEIVADLTGEYIFTDQQFVNKLSVEQPNIFKQMYDYIKHVYKMATAGSKEARQLEKAKRMFEKAYREMGRATTGKVDSNLTTEADSNTAEKQYSLMQFEDGKRFVEIDQMQERFAGHDVSEYPRIAKGIINEKFNGKVLGIDNKMFVNGQGRDEYVNPSKHIEGDIYEAKLRAAGELDNLLDAGTNFRNEPDGRDGHVHKNAIDGFDYFDTLFKIGERYYEAVINIMNIKRGKLFKDVTKIKDVTQDVMSSYGKNPKSQFLRTSSMDIIPDNSNKGNTEKQFSVSDSQGRKLTKEQQEYFKDSKVRDDNGSLMVMYHGTPNGDFTTFRSGSYFTPNKEYADVYQSQGASSLGYKKTANKPDTYEVYLDIKKPFDTRNPKERKIFEEEYYGQWGMGTPLMDSGLPDWLDGEDLQEFLEENGYDYDGLILDEGGVGGYGDDVKSRGFSYVVFNPEQAKRVDNTKPTKDPDIRFSLSVPVEENKNLMALHNLRTSEVLKQLDWGGMPMPSIAVTDPSLVDHEGFGDVTLILNKDAIDPKKSKYNKVYGGDAYTPTFPPISYKANEEVAERVSDKINGLIEQVPSGFQGDLRRLRYSSEIEDLLNNEGGQQGLIDRFKDSYGMKQLYLVETEGQAVPVETKRVETQIDELKKETYDYVIEKLGADVVSLSKNNGLTGRQWFEQYGEQIKKVYRDFFIEGGSTEQQANNFIETRKPVYWVEKAREAAGYLENGGVTVQELSDYEKTQRNIDEKIKQHDYDSWFNNLFKGIEEKAGIRNKKELFTPSGTRRKFDVLHDPVTLENIVKAMRGDSQQKGQAAFGGSLSGAAAQEYGSIKDIKDASGRLGKLTEEEHKANNKYIEDTLNDIANRYANGKDWWDARNALVEAVALRETKAGIKSYLKQYDYVYKADDFIVDDLIELRDYIRNLPVPYFEAKPQRAVGFDEVGVFIIPNNADAALKQKLLEAGYSIAEYNPDIEGDRQNVVNQFEKYKFSLSSPGDIAPINRGRTRWSDIMLPKQEDIAPVKVVADPTDIAPVKTPVVEEDLQLSRPLTEEDLPLVEQERDEAFNNLPDYVPEDIEYYNEADTAPIDDAYLRLVAKNMRSELGLKGNQLAGLRRIIQDFSTSDEQNIATLYDAIESEFGTIQEPKKLAEVAEIKDALRTMRIKVSDVIKGDIPDYAKWKQKQFGKIRITNDGLDVDDVYEGLKDVYPGFFPDDIINPTDQLLKIAEVAGMDHKYMEEYLIPEEDLQEVTDYIYEAVTDYKQQKRLDAAREASKAPIDESMIPFEETVLETPTPEDIAPVKKEKQVEEAPVEEKEPRTLRQEIHKGYMDKIREAFSNKGYNFDDVLSNAKSKSTFSSVDNTPQRFIEKSLGYKEGQILNDLTTNKTALNESEGIKWLNSFTDRKNGLLAQIAKEYNIKPNSKEDAAAQMYGEGFYLNDAGDLIKYGDAELALDFPDATVRNNIKKLATDPRIRQIYDETLDAINASRKRNGYPEIPRRDNYFLHFRAMEDTWSRLGLPFNPNDIRVKDLPTDINGMTADLKPGQPYFGSARQRKGLRTSHSLIGGMERYLGGAKNQIYHIDDIQILRALRNYVADMYGQANGLEGLDVLTEEEAEARIKQVYDAHLSNFAKFLNEQANVLAGKTSLADRGLEGIIGRRGIVALDTLNSQVGKGFIGFNVSSSLTNLVSTAQAFAKANKYDAMKALSQTIYNRINSIYGKSDGFVENDPTMIRRRGAQKLHRTPIEKVSDLGYSLMSGVDSISSEFIIRAKYNELTRKGMSDEKAHIEAGKWASRILGDRSLGQQPHLYNSKMLGLFTKFQLEVRNQLDSQFYDTIQEANVSTEQIQDQRQRNAAKAAKITSTFVQLAVFQHLFGKAFEAVAGYNPVFDIISVLIKILGFDDDEESEDTVLDNLEQGFLELLGDLPYTSTFTGGRIPIESALPIEQFITGKDQYGNEKSRWETLAEAAPYYSPFGGYSQVKKTVQGLGMFDSDLPVSGSYTDSGNLRFPVEDTPLNRLQAGIFGQYASGNARDYFDNERQPLKEKQIQEYKDLDLPISDYWKYREGLKEQKTVEDKFNYIAGLDLPVDKKNIMINNAVDRKETVDLINYDDFGSYEEFDFATRYPEKYEFFENNGISYRDYKESEESKEAYNWAYNNPEKFSVAKAAAPDVVTYRSYAADLNDIKADKDGNGKTISGSRKTKVANYINSLDADYGSKLILFKSEYPADDRYNNEIVEYLNSRQDISYDEEVTILTELGFVVDANGNVHW